MEKLEKRLFIAAACLAGLFFVFMQVVRSVEPLGMDQGLFACFGRWIPDGLLPYRDLYDTKPPLFLYAWVPAWSIGRSALSAWCFEAVWLAGTMIYIYLIASRLMNPWAGLLSAMFLFLGLWSPGFGGYMSRMQAEELAALPMLVAGWYVLESKDRFRSAFWAGFWTGIAGLYKVPALSVVFAWTLFWVFSEGWKSRRLAAGKTGWMILGMLVPWAVVVVWFSAHGALGDFLKAVFVHQRHYAAVISPPWMNVFAGMGRITAAALTGIIPAAAAGFYFLFRDYRKTGLWLAFWLFAVTAAVVLQRQLAPYHFLIMVPPLAMTAAFGVVCIANKLLGGDIVYRITAGTALAVIVFLQCYGLLDWKRAYSSAAAHRFGRIDRLTYLSGMQVGVFSPAVEKESAEYLRSRTGAGELILVWGLSPGIYALSGRRPATRYAFHKLLLTEAPLSLRIPGLAERRRTFLQKIRAVPPSYILVGVQDQNPFEPLDSMTSFMQFEPFKNFVRTNYKEETRMGRFVFLKYIGSS